MTFSDPPVISIGLPVYNGQRYLDEAIDSVLSQTFENFELLIADNSSTDDSLAIARKRQRSEPRIRLLESSHNLGAAPNFNRVFTASRGRYFKWVACDDLIEPEFLQRSIDCIEADSATVLVYSDAMDIDADGKEIGLIYDSEARMRTDSEDPVSRFRDLVLTNHSCISVFGLIRSDALRKTGLIGSFVGSDRILLAELALLGPFARIEDPLILHREHPGRSTRSIPQLADRAAWFDTSLSASRVFPHWRLLKEYASVISRSEMSLRENAHCRIQLLRWIRWGGWRSLLDDLR